MLKFTKELSHIADEVTLLRSDIFGAIISANNMNKEMAKLKYDDYKKQLQKIKTMTEDLTRAIAYSESKGG